MEGPPLWKGYVYLMKIISPPDFDDAKKDAQNERMRFARMPGHRKRARTTVGCVLRGCQLAGGPSKILFPKDTDRTSKRIVGWKGEQDQVFEAAPRSRASKNGSGNACHYILPENKIIDGCISVFILKETASPLLQIVREHAAFPFRVTRSLPSIHLGRHSLRSMSLGREEQRPCLLF